MSRIRQLTAALIGGVFMLPDRRRKGYPTACPMALCCELLRDGIEPCLFYDSPQAGSIYLRLGFEHIGTWRLLQLRAKVADSGG